ncbi:MAG: radical SAM protein [Sulfuricella denitrificans]|nr:radical SAM protein [Sulfuricella denitrificans]
MDALNRMKQTAATERILFVVPPNITFDDFVTPPANVGTVRLSKSDKPFGSVITDIPLGIISLSAYLKAHLGIDAMAIDFNVQLLREAEFEFGDFRSYFLNHLQSAKFREFSPTVVAISAQFSPSYHSVIDLAEVSRSLFPEAMILAGGNLVTAMYRELFLDTGSIDAICFGEGELPLVELLAASDRHEVMARHASWVTREKALAPGNPFQHCFIENLDEIPFLDYDILDLDGYQLNPTLSRYSVGAEVDRAISIMTSRGCPFKCTFCASHQAHGRRMRYYSEARVEQDIDLLIERYGVRSFIIQDDHFMGGKERPYNIVSAIKARQGSIFFQNALAIYALDKRFLTLLKEAGIDELVLPIESGSARVLKDVMRKPLKLDIVQRVLADCREAGIFTDCNIIVGMPGETMDDIDESRAFLKSIYGDWFRVFIATPIPGSEMYDEAARNDYFVINPVKANYKRAVIETKDWTAEYIQHMTYAMNIELNFVHNSNMRLGHYRTALDCFDKVLKVKPDHAIACFYAGRCLAHLGETEKAQEYFSKAQAYGADSFWKPYIEMFQIPLFQLGSSFATDANVVDISSAVSGKV